MKKITGYLILALSLHSSLSYSLLIRIVPIAKDPTDQTWKLLLINKDQKLVDIKHYISEEKKLKNKIIFAKEIVELTLNALSLKNIASLYQRDGYDITFFVHVPFVPDADLRKKSQQFQEDFAKKTHKAIPEGKTDFTWVPVENVIEGKTITIAAKNVDIDLHTTIMLNKYLKDSFEELKEMKASQGTVASSTKQSQSTKIDDKLKRLNVLLNELSDELSAAYLFTPDFSSLGV